MTRALTLGAAVALVAALATGCSKSGSGGQSATRPALPEDMPVCSELFADGKTVERDTFGEACKGDDGELAVPRPVALECTDGRLLLWNDYAWGYVDEPMTVIQTGVNDQDPIDQSMECLKSTGSGATTTTAG